MASSTDLIIIVLAFLFALVVSYLIYRRGERKHRERLLKIVNENPEQLMSPGEIDETEVEESETVETKKQIERRRNIEEIREVFESGDDAGRISNTLQVDERGESDVEESTSDTSGTTSDEEPRSLPKKSNPKPRGHNKSIKLSE